MFITMAWQFNILLTKICRTKHLNQQLLQRSAVYTLNRKFKICEIDLT